jgi:hypothetical protein
MLSRDAEALEDENRELRERVDRLERAIEAHTNGGQS